MGNTEDTVANQVYFVICDQLICLLELIILDGRFSSVLPKNQKRIGRFLFFWKIDQLSIAGN